MEVFTLAALAALVVKATSLLKLIRAQLFGDAITQVVAAAIGVGVAFLARAADAMAAIDIAGHPLGSLDDASTALVGLALASAGSFAYDWKKAVDGSDSAAEPPLLPKANQPEGGHAGVSVLAIVIVVVLLIILL